ncbi:PREDICTED: uncharacterized protein LOC105449744 [Wasmannia auropunctata]|uniref:uncharacterized protein LOC105449744 n=1 Tax=Wasmannia auropunctata TaxID=64793 RepID=UPI0005EF2B65|nr:PREDICTED: uncharacterized protein LOC105449744 [Wasmannia auropunctata]
MDRPNIFANLNVTDRGKIIGLHEAGLNISQIALTMGITRRTAALWITKYEEAGMNNLKDHRKNNRAPQKTTLEDNEEIVRAIDENPFNAAATVLQNRNLNISVNTVGRRLKTANVHSRAAAKKIELNPEHRRQRMQFARDHLNTPQEEWNAVMWMDKKASHPQKMNVIVSGV